MNNETILLNKSEDHYATKDFATKAVSAFLLVLIALALAGWGGELAQKYWNLENKIRYALQGIIMSGIVVPGIWMLRTRIDRGKPKSIGVGNWQHAFARFGLGLGFILVPIILTISLVVLFGWATITVNMPDGMLKTIALGIAVTFFFEALPEELAFRAYIYSHLNTYYKRWTSALITVGLFTLLPILLFPILKYILGMDATLGDANTITVSYVITMLFFGLFMQYLRILTNSVWTGIGFHLMFVYINRMIGPEPSNYIQVTEVTNQSGVQILFAASLLIVFIGLIAYPLVKGVKLGWNDTQA